MSGPMLGGGRVFAWSSDGPGWQDVGLVGDGITLSPALDDDVAEALAPLRTVWDTQVRIMEAFDIPTDFLRTMFGDYHVKPTPRRVEVQFEAPPVRPPRKRRGLTGKAYRIARRRYGRTMRAWIRGDIPGVPVRLTLPSAVMSVNDWDDDART